MFDYADRLRALDAADLRRTRRVVEDVDGPRLVVDGEEFLAFCSNDYLGLAQHPAPIEAARRAAMQWGVGSTASPLVCGHSAEHEALEATLARFVGLPRALAFYAGYGLSVGVIPALVERGDAIFSDALNHACLIDGARLSRAEIHRYPHADTDTLAALLAASRAPRKLVITDAVFSMDGDLAPLPAILALCERHDALLLVDDAHGFGVLGAQGRGAMSHFGLDSPRVLYMATLGKAAGVAGAFVAGDATLIEWLMQKTRSYLFATAMPPMLAAALRTSVEAIANEGWRRVQLRRLGSQLRTGLDALPWRVLPSASAIHALILGENARSLAVMEALRRRGLWVPAIRPPTVQAGTARLRITLSAAHTEDDVSRLVAALQAIAATDG